MPLRLIQFFFSYCTSSLRCYFTTWLFHIYRLKVFWLFCTFFRFLSPQHVQIITTFFRQLCAYSTLSYAFSTIYRYFHFVSPSFLCFYVKFQQILLVMFRCPPPLLGRNAENLSKITIKSGYCCESAVQCNVTYGGICLSQLFARCPDQIGRASCRERVSSPV